MGADLRGARLAGCVLRRAKLVGAQFDENAIGNCDRFGYAPSRPESIKPLVASTSPCNAVVWSLDGEWIASGHEDGSVRLWETASGFETCRFQGHQGGVRSVAFSLDGRLLASAGADNTVRLWALAEGREQARLSGHQGGVRSVAFSPDGRLLASAGDDNTVRLWTLAEGREQARLSRHEGGVWSMAFSPDGRLLASAGDDNTVRLWEVATGHCLAILAHLREGWVAYTPDGRYKFNGEIAGGFWHTIGLCRFEPGELDPYLPKPLRMPDDEILVPLKSDQPA